MLSLEIIIINLHPMINFYQLLNNPKVRKKGTKFVSPFLKIKTPPLPTEGWLDFPQRSQSTAERYKVGKWGRESTAKGGCKKKGLERSLKLSTQTYTNNPPSEEKKISAKKNSYQEDEWSDLPHLQRLDWFSNLVKYHY